MAMEKGGGTSSRSRWRAHHLPDPIDTVRFRCRGGERGPIDRRGVAGCGRSGGAARARPAQPTQSEATGTGRTIAPDQAVIEGRVVGTNSPRPISGATVQAMGSDGTVETQTDENGRYALRLKPGSYTMAVRAQGFVDGYFGRDPAALTGFGAQVVARGGSAVTGIDVRLQAAGGIQGRNP